MQTFFFFFFKKCERLGCMILISDLTPGYLFLRSLCPANGKGSWNIVIHFSLWLYCRAVRYFPFVSSFPFCHPPSPPQPQPQALFEKGTYQTLTALSCMSSCSKAFRSQKRALALKYVYVYLYIYTIYICIHIYYVCYICSMYVPSIYSLYSEMSECVDKIQFT